MKRRVTAKYWNLSCGRPDQSLHSILNEIVSSGPPGTREKEIDTDYIVRLERLDPVGPLYAGEVCRVQRSNIPPTVDPDGMQPMNLTDGKGFGHRSTFLCDHMGENVLWQQDNMGCTPEKFGVYLAQFGTPVYLSSPTPYTTHDAWDEIETGSGIVSSFTVKVAPERNLALLDQGDDPLIELARKSVNAYKGQSLDITVAIDKSSDTSLDKGNVTRTLKRALSFSGTSKAKATLKGDAGSRILDFINQHKFESGLIIRDSDDLDVDWKSRKDFLVKAYHGSFDHANGDENQT